MTYNTAGTAKVRGSRASQQYLWVELWVGKSRRQPSHCIYGAKLYNCIHDLASVNEKRGLRSATETITYIGNCPDIWLLTTFATRKFACNS